MNAKISKYIETFKTILMKLSILCMILFGLVSGSIAKADPIDLSRSNPPPKTEPSSLFNIPVSASINTVELGIYFENPVGQATIIVTDDSNQVVYQETVNTDSSSEILIPVNQWTSGNYRLTINYGTTSLWGDFQVE